MATKAWVAKMAKDQKFAVRYHNRCQICGRARGYYRDFGLCRICLRKMAHQGLIPGLRKSSWYNLQEEALNRINSAKRKVFWKSSLYTWIQSQIS